MMKVNDFIKALKKAEKSKTLYVMGCFGAPLNEKNKARYTKNNSYNCKRAEIINAATDSTFGFDCVCLIKGILWGWNADKSKVYGGATYASNNVPDIGADSMFTRKYVQNISNDFTTIKPGAVVHMSGHVGVYIGSGQVIECSPKWKNCVQITYLGNLPEHRKGNYRIWSEFGYLPTVDYSVEVKEKPVKVEECVTRIHKVVKGDNLTNISKKYGTSIDAIIENNIKKYPRMTRNYIVIGWELEV